MNGQLPPGGGAPQQPQQPQQNPYQPPLGQGQYQAPPGAQGASADKRALISMIVGIAATVLCCVPLVGLICGPIAIIFFVKFNGAYRQSGETLGGRGMSIAGLVTGIVGLAGGLFWTVYWVLIMFVVSAARHGAGLKF